MLVDIAGDNLALILHKLCHVRCLAAGSAAHIQHAHSGLGHQHRRYQHGAFVLNVKLLRQCRQKCMQRRQMLCHNSVGTPFGSTHLRTHFRQIRQQLVARSHQRINTQAHRRSRIIKRQQAFGAASSPRSQPALHQPARMVIFQRQIIGILLFGIGQDERACLLLTQQTAQNAVDKLGAALMAHRACQLHSLVYCRRRRNACHIQQLVGANAQYRQNITGHLIQRTADALRQIPVKRTAGLHRAVYQLCCQPSVKVAQSAATQILVQRDIRISAVLQHHTHQKRRCSASAFRIICFLFLPHALFLPHHLP